MGGGSLRRRHGLEAPRDPLDDGPGRDCECEGWGHSVV